MADQIAERLRHPKATQVEIEAAAEIERLRAHIAEIEKWKEEGERIIAPAAKWGPDGNALVRSSTLFKLGAWWEHRPWKHGGQDD